MAKTERTHKVSLSTDHLSRTVGALALMVEMGSEPVSGDAWETLEALCDQVDVDPYDVLSSIRRNTMKERRR